MHAAAADSPLLKAFHRADAEIVPEPQFFICEGPEMLHIPGELLQNSQRNEESDDQTEVFHDFPSFSMTFSESSPMFTDVHRAPRHRWPMAHSGIGEGLGPSASGFDRCGASEILWWFYQRSINILYIYISNDYGMIIDYSYSGWWLSHPSEKSWSSSMGRTIPCMKWKITNVPNHQPDIYIYYIQYKYNY